MFVKMTTYTQTQSSQITLCVGDELKQYCDYRVDIKLILVYGHNSGSKTEKRDCEHIQETLPVTTSI